MTSSQCRWGILGTASIARKNWKAIWLADNATLTGVGSRSVERAQEYIDENQAFAHFQEAPQPFGSYDELLNSDTVDAVYVPVPTGMRKDYVIKAAEAGKHVLAEKPCAPNAADVQAMLDACNANGVQYMDGVMFMHSKRLDAIRDVLNDGESVGDIKRIASQFSFCAPEDFLSGNIRVNSELEPLGALGDLGWYNLRFALWVMNYAKPLRVSGRMLSEAGREDSPNPVPTEFSGELFFDGGVSASFYCSFLTENQQWANISGNKGHIHLRDFVLPFFGAEAGFDVSNHHFDVQGCDFRMQDRTKHIGVNEYSDGSLGSQEINLFRNFSELVLSGKPDQKWGEISLLTQQVMDACLQSARDGGATLEFNA